MNRRTLTKEEWRKLHTMLEGVDSVQIVVLHSAPPEPTIIGDRFVCSPDYSERLRFTVDLIGPEEVSKSVSPLTLAGH